MKKNKPKVTFVFPCLVRYPVGGFKVVFEYANGLVQRGYQVTLVFPAVGLLNAPTAKKIRGIVSYFLHRLDKAYRPDSWFKLDQRVQLLWVPSLAERYLPDADVIVATAWQTAEFIANYQTRKGAKFYLLQHLENWSGSNDRVLSTWKLPLNKIAIAKWLVEIAQSLGETAKHIPNGLDFGAFGIDVLPESRDPLTVVMLHHKLEWKGFSDGLKAISLVQKRYPELQLLIFGVSAKPKGLPDWVTYFSNPPQSSLREIYNRAAIVVAPSWEEGWGLVPSEGLMCGCALVATDVGGHQEFAIHEKTALLSKPRQPEEMSENILALISDQERRIHLAYSGNEYIQQFTWERAIGAFDIAVSRPTGLG